MKPTKSKRLVIASIAVFASTPGYGAEPTLSKAPLSADEVQIYQTFLEFYARESSTTLVNLARLTEPLDLSRYIPGTHCLKGIELENLNAALSTVHTLGPSLERTSPKVIRLVDPAEQNVIISGHFSDREAGLLTISEIGFDKRHKYAVFRYFFGCGPVCGRGGMVVLHKDGSKWHLTKRNCGRWFI